jgi:hypothetical protein
LIKKLLPSLIPVLTGFVTVVSPDVQHAITGFVAAHTGWASLISAFWLVVNHWIPSPSQNPGSSFTGISGSMLAVFMCMVLVMAPLVGCTFTQDDVIKAVQNSENVFKTAQTFLPQAQLIADELQQTDPEAAEYIGAVVSTAGPALQKLISASDNYLAVPGNSTYQAILNLTDSLVAQIDQAALKFAGIKNPQSQQKVTAWIVIFSTGLHVGLGVLEHYATKGQINSMPKVAHVDFRPFIDRDYARRELAAMGYKPDAAIQAAGF